MKTKRSLAVLSSVVALSVVCVLLIAAGVGHAQSTDTGYTVDLPVVTRTCNPKTSAYTSASQPVVRVGDTITLTEAIVNECARLVGQPRFMATSNPMGVLSPAYQLGDGYADVPIGEYRELTTTWRAVGIGSVTISSSVMYETRDDYEPPGSWDYVAADPIVVRVMPNRPQ